MAAVFQNVVGIAQESLIQLEDSMAAMATFYRDYEPEFATSVNKGDTIRIRRPPTFVAHEFDGVNPTPRQEVKEGQTTLVLEKFLDTTVELTDKDLTLNFRDFAEQIATPAMMAIAQRAEAYVLSKYAEIHQIVGAADKRFDSLGNMALISAYLSSAKIPMNDRVGLVDNFVASDLRASADLVRADALGDGGRAMQDAWIGRKAGVNWMESEAVPLHTAGTISNGSARTAKCPAMAIGATSGTFTDTTLTGTVKVGDVFTIAGLNTPRGVPISFVVTADATAASNAIAISFSPALPAAVTVNTVATFVASHAVGIVGNRRGLAYAMVAPAPPLGNAQPSATVNYRGLGIRVVFGYDMNIKKNIVSFDTMVGAKVIQPELLFRLISTPAIRALA